jgi:iron complex outermembrane recepter protein
MPASPDGRGVAHCWRCCSRSPLETRLALDYDHAAWQSGALLRVVAAQDRYALNQGNIVGQDIGPTSGFALLSSNAGWRPRPGLLLAVRVDNLFDRTYAEHLGRAGSTVTGFLQTTRAARLP